MTDPKKIAENLRRYNAWRRNNDEDLTLEMPDPKELGIWIDSAIEALEAHAENNDLAQRVEKLEAKELIERLREYAENNGYSHGDYADSLKQAAREIESLEAERDALAAELKALREQEPVGIVDEGDDGVFADLETTSGVLVKLGDKLYARPVPADPVNARLLDTLKKCRDQFERSVEHHLDKGDHDKAAVNESFAWLAGAAISEAERFDSLAAMVLGGCGVDFRDAESVRDDYNGGKNCADVADEIIAEYNIE